MLPRRQEYVLKLKAGEKTYILEYQEATAEETQEFEETVTSYRKFYDWFIRFIAKLDCLDKREVTEIIKFISIDNEQNIQTISEKIITTRHRFYKSKYH